MHCAISKLDILESTDENLEEGRFVPVIRVGCHVSLEESHKRPR